MTVVLKSPNFVNGTAVRHVKVQRALRGLKEEVEHRAKANLAKARASTRWDKISGPEHLTKITSSRGTGKYGGVDYEVAMLAPNALAIELGHGPSGFFDPDRYGKVTKAPHGLYILTRAAFVSGISMTPAMGRRIGKR